MSITAMLGIPLPRSPACLGPEQGLACLVVDSLFLQPPHHLGLLGALLLEGVQPAMLQYLAKHTACQQECPPVHKMSFLSSRGY